MTNLLQKLVLGSSTTALLAAAPFTAAFAQGSDDIEQVVVSASRITIAGYTAPTPVTVIGAAQLQAGAFSNITDALKELPQVNNPPSNVSMNNGGASNSAGGNFINLRNLGNIRTLVLFDGQRVVASSLLNAGVDVTTFPTTLIQRVDVVTGGASATWGSDAVAGVVNFILDKNYNGFKATLQGGDTSDGLRRSFVANGAWGGDIAGGRGHVEFAAEGKFNPDTVLITQEGWFRNAYWVSNPAFTPGSSLPQLIVANNVGPVQTTPGGIISSSTAGVAGPGVVAASANALRGIEFGAGGVPSIVNYGNVTNNGVSNGGSLSTTDGQWYGQQVASANRAYTLFGYGRYKLTDHIQLSAQANYGYFYQKSAGGFFAQNITIKSDNAYIPASVRSAMQNGGIATFVLGTLNSNNSNSTDTGQNFFADTQGSLTPITNINKRILVRGVVTLEGTLGDDWSWNAYAQHSGVRLNEITPNNPIQANLLAAEDAVTVTSANVGKTGLALGSIACRTTLNGVPVTAGTSTIITAQPGCVPLDVFGTGVASPAAISYINGLQTGEGANVHQSFKQEVFEASMQGVLPWEMPAGKVAVAFGAGYRKENAVGAGAPGPYGLAGAYASGSLTNFPPSEYNVMEGFAEVEAPILKNNIVNDLSISMAGRMTGYSTSGLVETWKLGATSQVTDDIKLRVTWSTDIRAPQINELFQPASSIFASGVVDPKTGLVVPSPGLNRVTVGNPNLLPEVAHTISYGAVLTPTFLPGLSLSADWYHINVTGLITTIPEATVLAQCSPLQASPIYPGQQGNPNDPLCAQILVFNGPGGALSGDNLKVINLASQTVSGLDLAANYTTDLWDGNLALATTDAYNDENTTCNPGVGCNDGAGLSTNGVTIGPKWRGTVQATYSTGPYSLTVQSRWWGTGINAQNGNTGNKATAATANLYDPTYFHTPFYAYLDLRGTYKWNDNISFFGAVDDALNTPPPLVPNAASSLSPGGNIGMTNNAVWSLLGREFRIGVRLNY